MRSRPPCRLKLPSIAASTPSLAPMSRMSLAAPLKCERAGPCHDLKTGNTSEFGDQLVREAIGEVLVVRVAAQASEREHDNTTYEEVRGRRFRLHKLGSIARSRKQDPPAFVRTFALVILF